MYYGWKAVQTPPNGGSKTIEKYSPLITSKKDSIEEIGIARRNNSSLPLFSMNGQIVTIRNFGRDKTTNSKIIRLLDEEKSITIVGGPCLFSRSQLGVFDSNRQFCSLAVPSLRENIPQDISGLKIGKAITPYHERHVSFMRSTLKSIKEVTRKELLIKLVIPCIEYTTYIPDFWSSDLKTEYWEGVKKGSEEVESYYYSKLSCLGELEITRKQFWDPSDSKNGNNTSRDISSYVKSYTNNISSKIVIAVEDLVEFPLAVEVGKNMQYLIGILGVLAQREEFFNKEEEIHPYIV